MSNVIDQRVVEMKFDNKDFESNVKTSLSTLDKLKQGLNLNGASKGLENLGSAAKSFDLSGIGSAVESISSKFSALGIMGVTVLTNITNSAFDAGKKIVSALTIDPIKTGLQEYETQINAIQTILANTSHNGTTLDEVNAALDELNKYADLTIYNFTEMTKNIGTFTAAGLDLDTSVKGIQGIANLAAVSGSTSQQASTAMYQLSQAMAAGVVGLQDWNSVVNAGMGGKVFQDAIMQTAKDISGADAAVALAIEKYEEGASFRSILNAKENGAWLTSDILVAALSKFTKTGAVEYLSDLYDVSASSIEELQKLGDTTGYNTKEFDKMVMSLAEGDQAMADNIKQVLSMATTATNAATEVKTLSQLWDTLKETAQSGWTQTWELIVGDFEEAKSLLSGVYNTLSPIIEASAAARNELLQGWKDAGGRDDMIQSFRNVYEAIKSIINPIKEAFREIFPPTTSEQLVAFTEGIKNLTEKFKLSETASENLKRTFKGLFAVVDIVKEAFSAILKSIFPLVGGIDDLGGGILSVTAKIGDWLVQLRNSVTEADVFNNAAQKISGVITSIITKFKEFAGIVNEKFVSPSLEVFQSLLDRTKERTDGICSAATSMKNAFLIAFEAMSSALENSNFFGMMGTLWNGIVTLGKGVATAFGALAKGLGGIFAGANFSGFFDIVNSLIAGGIGVGIMKFLKSVTGTIESLQDIKDGFVDIFDGFRGVLEAYQTSLKADVLQKIAISIAILVGSLLVVSLIDSEKLSKAVGAITMLFGGLVGSMSVLDKLNTGIKGASSLVTTMIGMSTAVLILASALKSISDIDSGGLTKSLIGIAGLSAILVKTAQALGSEGSKAMKGATQLVIFAAAIKILASACDDLATLSWNELAKGLTGVGVLMTSVSIFLNNTKFNSKSILTATGIVILASAIKVLASACETFATMSWGEIGKGLAAVGALLVEITAFTNLTGNAKHILSAGVSLIAIAAAMNIFASALKDFGSMKWNEIGKGLTAMGAALAEVAIAVKLMPKNMIGIGTGLVIVASALLILSNSLSSMGEMSWGEIAKGLVALGGSMGVLAIGLNAMTGTIGGSAALLVASVALLALTPALTKLGNMSWESIAKGLISIAGAFTIIGVAGALLTPLVPTILALAGSFALIGAGILGIGAGLLAAGAGLSALAVGITALGTSMAASATAIVAAITVIITGIIALIPTIIGQIKDIIVAICKVIAESATAIGEAVKAVVLSLVDVLVTCIPAIADGALKLIVGVLDALVEYTPQIVELLFDFLIRLIDSLATKLPELITSAVNLFAKFFAGIIDALKGIDTSTLIEAIAGIGLLTAIIAALSAVASFIPGAMVGILGIGAIIAELAIVLAAIGALAQIPGLDWFISEGGELLQSIGVAIGKFVGGIAGGVAEGFTSSLPQIGTDLSDFMTNITPFIEGAKKIDESVLNGVKAIADVIMTLTAANILEGLTSWFTGGSALDKFGSQLPQLGTNLSLFAKNLGTFGEAEIASISCAASAIKSMAEAADLIPNEGGWVGKILGENSIAKFASQLPALGAHLKAFADSLGNFDESKIATVTCAANAIKEMAEAADLIPNEGGWVAKIVGDNSISKFAAKLPELGTNLKDFAANLGTFTNAQISTISCAANAIKEMALASEGINGQAEWAKVLFGDNSITAFSSELPALGTNLNNFINNLGTFGSEQISTVNSTVSAINALASLANADLKGAKKNLEGFGEKIVQLGKDIASFVKGMPSTDNLTAAVNNVNKILSMIDDISGSDANIATNFTKSLSKIGKDGVDKFVDAFTSSSAKTDVKEAGIKLIQQIVKGVESETKNTKEAFKDVAETCALYIETVRSDFYDAGAYLVDGFVAGITANTWRAEAEARAMARAAAIAAEEELAINSPSKVFYRIGDYTGQGFVNALSDYGDKSYKAGSKMASSARNGLNDSISKIKDIINGDIDAQPTIRPVLDLSNLRTGINAVSGLLDREANLGLMTNVSSINARMNGRIQNGPNSEVVSAIDRLRKDINNTPGGTTIIDGITYDDGSNVSEAVKDLIRAARIERRR